MPETFIIRPWGLCAPPPKSDHFPGLIGPIQMGLDPPTTDPPDGQSRLLSFRTRGCDLVVVVPSTQDRSPHPKVQSFIVLNTFSSSPPTSLPPLHPQYRIRLDHRPPPQGPQLGGRGGFQFGFRAPPSHPPTRLPMG